MTHKRSISRVAAAAIVIYASPALSAGSPWLPAPGGGSVAVSYVSQSATEFYRSTAKRPTPGGGAELSQQTIWIEGVYGISDAVALDVRLGRASSSFITGEGLPPSLGDVSGFADVNIGVVWRPVDEIVRPSLPSVAFRATAIVAGDYETGYINSIGDGGNGFELSAIVGKYIGDRFAVSGEVGYRNRDSNTHDIPESVFARLSAGMLVGGRVGLSLNYEMDDSRSGIEIGGPGFSPSRFPELQEEFEILGPSISFAVSDRSSVVAAFAKVVGGRNTAVSDVFSVSFSYSLY